MSILKLLISRIVLKKRIIYESISKKDYINLFNNLKLLLIYLFIKLKVIYN